MNGIIAYSRKCDKHTATAILAAVESTLPTAPLAHSIEPGGKVRTVKDPGAWCATNLARETPAVICNGVEKELVSFSTVSIPAEYVPEKWPVIQVQVFFPWIPKYIERVLDLVAAFGRASGSYWALCSSVEVGAALARGVGRTSPDPGYPRPHAPSVLIPGRLSWISYWSRESCSYLQFSPEDVRTALFAQVVTVDGHRVVLQLSEDVLDLDRPEHLFAVERAYKAFPEIDNNWGL